MRDTSAPPTMTVSDPMRAWFSLLLVISAALFSVPARLNAQQPFGCRNPSPFDNLRSRLEGWISSDDSLDVAFRRNYQLLRASFFRGDTAAAGNRSLSVLRARDRDWTRWQTYPFGDEPTYWVVRSGGLSEAVAWARGLPSLASRAAGLLEIGEALDEVTHLDKPMRHHPLVNTCRDDFI